ncbi:MAG: serine/threonine protein kinase [Lachnospiraceae bacterium]|nr:serine/threonine protein kinase [Lachnospiraceae bacterium]
MLSAVPVTGWSVAGRYQILSLIGQGGQSRVYLALDRRSGEKCVIKELREDIADVPAARRALLLEGELLSRLHHPGLPAAREIVDRGESTPLLIVRDYVEGTSLWHLLRRKGPMSEQEAVRLGLQICQILIYLHAQDPPVIYRDMKPGNLLMDTDGCLKLIDFGCARYLSLDAADQPDTIPLGTPGYAAPEQFGTGARTDRRTDVYGLGVTLFELLTGLSPSSLNGTLPPVRNIRPSVSPFLEQIILKCTSPEPSVRYQDCSQLAAVLKNWKHREPLRLLARSGRYLALTASIALTVLLGMMAHPRFSLAGSNTVKEPVMDDSTLAFYREMEVMIRDNRQTLRDAGMNDDDLEEILGYISACLEDAE